MADDHFYYLRKEGDNCYVLYCDRGDIVGNFHLEEGYYFQGFCKYDSRFYVILYHPDSAEKDRGFGNSLLAVVDFSTGNLRILRKIGNVTYYDPYFYKDKIKLYEDYDVCEDVDDDENDGKEDTYQYDIIGDEEPDHSREKYSEYDYTVDGYRYYAKTGKEVRIFRQNLKSQREEEIFRYQTKHQKDTDYVYNSKYIFWTDQLNQVHRWNRRTQKEETVIKTKMYSGYLDLSCTEEGLYLQKANPRNIQLYYMEADGDEFRRIQFANSYAEEYYEGDWEDYGFR